MLRPLYSHLVSFNSKFMKTLFKIFSFIILFVMASCSSPDFSLEGRWVVDELNFDFDERRNTPEMISQIGQEESKDELIFRNDSIVYIKMLTYEGDYRYAINEKSEITFEDATSDNNKLGILKNNKIYSEQNTAIGKMRIVFVKSEKLKN